MDHVPLCSHLRLLPPLLGETEDRKSTRLNSSHSQISYAVFCLKKKKKHLSWNDEIKVVAQLHHLFHYAFLMVKLAASICFSSPLILQCYLQIQFLSP